MEATETLFCLLSVQDCWKNRAFREGEWLGLLEVAYQQSVIHTLKENLYFFEYFDGFSGELLLY